MQIVGAITMIIVILAVIAFFIFAIWKFYEVKKNNYRYGRRKIPYADYEADLEAV